MENEDLELLLECDNDVITCSILKHYSNQMTFSLVDICIGLLHCRMMMSGFLNIQQLEYLKKLTSQQVILKIFETIKLIFFAR